MLEFKDFYDIAEYGNVAWKGSFTPREVAYNAYDYLCEFETSKADGVPTHTIKELAKLLAEDGTNECKDWLYEMAKELNLIDMDFMDYIESDEDVVTRFLVDKPKKNVTETVEELSKNYGVIDLLTAAIMRNNSLSYEEAEDIALRLNSSDYLFDRMIDDFIDDETD